MADPVKPEIKARVFEVADRLSAALDGAVPKLDDVRREAGVSMNQASPAMREWRELHRTGGQVVAKDVPTRISEIGTKLLSDVWTTASNEAATEIARIKSECEARIAEEVETSGEICEDNDRLRLLLEEVKSQLQKSEAALAEAKSEIAMANQAQRLKDERLTEIRADLDAVKQAERVARDEAASYRGQVELLSSQLTAQTKDLMAQSRDVNKKPQT